MLVIVMFCAWKVKLTMPIIAVLMAGRISAGLVIEVTFVAALLVVRVHVSAHRHKI